MTTVQEIITDAYREANLIAVGDSPTQAEINETLPRYNNMVLSWFGNELGDQFQDWVIPDPKNINKRFTYVDSDDFNSSSFDLEPPPNARILVTSTGGGTQIKFPKKPSDGARMQIIDIGSTADITINGNGRLVDGLSSSTLAAPLVEPVEWFYRADRANWTRITSLLTTDETLLPTEFNDLQITSLAVRLMSRYGNEPRSGTVETLRSGMSKLKARYSPAINITTQPDLIREDTFIFGM